MYGYNAGPPMAFPIYTILPYCVIIRESVDSLCSEVCENNPWCEYSIAEREQVLLLRSTV